MIGLVVEVEAQGVTGSIGAFQGRYINRHVELAPLEYAVAGSAKQVMDEVGINCFVILGFTVNHHVEQSVFPSRLGLSMQVKSRADRWLKRLLMLHGVFFVSCFIMPMTGMFRSMANGENSNGGVIALVIWCTYFLPVGVLAYRHFR